MSDWPERFRELDVDEMKFDIQMIECHLPDPWYRLPAICGVIVSLFGGFGLMLLGALCTTTYGPVILFVVSGMVSVVMSLLLLWKYDDWTDDPCSLMLDKKMYRGEEEGRGLFKSHSQVNAHTLDLTAAKVEARALEDAERRKRLVEEERERVRFAALSEEDKIQEKLQEVEEYIAKTLLADYTHVSFTGKGSHTIVKPIWALNLQDRRDLAYESLAAEGWVEA